MVRRSGRGVTPERLIELLKKELETYTQKELAKRIGINAANLCRYLKGTGEPTHETLETIADYFGVSVAELRGEDHSVDLRFDEDMQFMFADYKTRGFTIRVGKNDLVKIGITYLHCKESGNMELLNNMVEKIESKYLPKTE